LKGQAIAHQNVCFGARMAPQYFSELEPGVAGSSEDGNAFHMQGGA
jgi:hypothetical protein